MENIFNTSISKWNIKSICEQYAWSKIDGKENTLQFCQCSTCDYASTDFCPVSTLDYTACNNDKDCR